MKRLHRCQLHDSLNHQKISGFTEVGLVRILESVRAYAYLVLSLQASARSCLVGNTAGALTSQKSFLNNFKHVVNRRVDIREDIKRYQETLSYASRKVNYSMGESIYMLPSDMNLNIKSGTIGYNNKILVSDRGFILGRNDMVNALAAIHRAPIVHAPKSSHITPSVYSPKSVHTSATTHEDERVVLVLALASAFGIWYTFVNERY